VDLVASTQYVRYGQMTALARECNLVILVHRCRPSRYHHIDL